jgi:REP element-mobilizing transposase RayT
MPRSGDLRKGRFSEAGRAYHVTAVTNARQPLFSGLLPGRTVVRTLMHLDQQWHTNTWAYVVMPDHLHWLFSLNDDSTLAKVMHAAKGYSGLWSTSCSAGRAPSGRRVTMTTLSGAKKICGNLHAMSSPTRSGPDWWSGWATTPCGTPAGYERGRSRPVGRSYIQNQA